MKTNTRFSALLLLLLCIGASLFTACSTDDGEYVRPITQYEKMQGRWLLSRVVQTDEATQKQMDLTSLFDFGSLVINLNADAQGNPTDFSV